MTNGTVTGKSTGAGGSGITHPVVQELYDSVPLDRQHRHFHGKCVEAECLSEIAHKVDAQSVDDLRKATEGAKSNVCSNKDGAHLPPCCSCGFVLDQLGIKY